MTHENLFKIHIPEPCREDWGKMTPNEQGSFCQVCAKTVVDFSGQTEEQIQRYLLANIDKKVCGRFKINQLEPGNTPKLKLELEAPKYSFPRFLLPVITPFRAYTMALMLFASLAFSSCGNSGNGGGNDERLAGTVEIIDTTDNPYNHNNIIDSNNNQNFNHELMGGVSWSRAHDSTCTIKNINDDVMGKIAPIQTNDTLKTDTTETMIQGEIQKKEEEPKIKMGLFHKIEEEKDYKKGDVKVEN